MIINAVAQRRLIGGHRAEKGFRLFRGMRNREQSPPVSDEESYAAFTDNTEVGNRLRLRLYQTKSRTPPLLTTPK